MTGKSGADGNLWIVRPSAPLSPPPRALLEELRAAIRRAEEAGFFVELDCGTVVSGPDSVTLKLDQARLRDAE